MSLWDRVTLHEYDDALGDDIRHMRLFDPTNERCRGFGSGRSREHALLVAASELFERHCMLEMASATPGINSNGFAAHRSIELARSSARAELIERDIVMCAWLATKPPHWLSSLPTKFDIFSRANTYCRIGHLGTVNDVHVYVSLLTSSDGRFGCLFASAASADPDSALETLFVNQRRNLTYTQSLLYGAEKTQISDLAELRDPDSHRRFYLNSSLQTTWNWILRPGAPTVLKDDPRIVVEDVCFNTPTPWPIFVARATSLDLQGYFIGLPTPEKLNQKRLCDFGITDISRVNKLPHPLS